MYTFAYDYMKANPQIRADAVMKHWVALSKDPACSSVVRNELLEMTKREIEITDCSLFWYKHYREMFILFEKSRDIETPQSWLALNSKLAIYLYSILQIHNDYSIPKAWRLICTLPCEMYDSEIITMDLVTKIYAENNVMASGRNFMVILLRGVIENCSFILNDSDASEAKILFDCCTIPLIQSIKSRNDMLEMVQMIKDTDFKAGDNKFKSRNEIEIAHDIRTERVTQELIKDYKGERYVYTKELLEIVKQHGFFLPGSPEALFIRGKQHSNCVGTYAHKHSETENKMISSFELTRLFFTRETTTELRFEIKHDVIVSTCCIQHKGRYNRTMIQEDNLTALRVALTGKPKEIIHVEVKSDNN